MTSTAHQAWSRFVRVSKPYFLSERRYQAFGLLTALLALLLTVSALNVVISYVWRDFMNALTERRHVNHIFMLALTCAAVFMCSSATGALARFFEQLLALRWRAWLTDNFFNRYLSSHAYFHLNAQSDVDNPDQRIAEDIRTFTSTTLSFFVMSTNSAITVIAFVGVLWSITPWLLVAGILYPMLGTMLIVLMGRKLVSLSNLQLKKEADFRFELIHVRTHADSVALVQSESTEKNRLGQRLGTLVENTRSMIGVLLNIDFIRGGYNFMDQLIPVIIVAPLYLRGDVEFGVVLQASMAFSQIFNAFSLIAEKFQDLSNFAAVIGRVGALDEAISPPAAAAPADIQVADAPAAESPLRYQQVTLQAPDDDHVLVRDLFLEVGKGQHVLLTGPNAGKSALFRAAAGLWTKGSGRISRPSHRQVMFLPEQPYMVPGTLRDQFAIVASDGTATDERIMEALERVGLESLLERVGGLDAEHDWVSKLSLGEMQQIGFAQLLVVEPEFAFLDHAASALSETDRAELYQVIANSHTSYLSVGDREPGLMDNHDTLVELRPDGTWDTQPINGKTEHTNH